MDPCTLKDSFAGIAVRLIRAARIAIDHRAKTPERGERRGELHGFAGCENASHCGSRAGLVSRFFMTGDRLAWLQSVCQ